jgi:hypothetical protein
MSSSTSNSELGQPKFGPVWWWSAVGAAVLVVVACHYLLTGVWADPRAKHGTERTLAVASLSAETEVIFVGTSHVASGNPPALHSCRVMNLTLNGGSYEMLEKILERNLSKAPNARLVVLELDIVPLRMDTLVMLQGDGQTLWENGLTPADVYGPHPVKLADAYAMKFGRAFFIMKPLTPSQLWHNRTTWSEREARGDREPGYNPVEARMDRGSEDRGVADATSRPLDPEIVGRNRAALVRIVQRLRAEGRTVALVRLPYHEAVRRGEPPVYEIAVEEALREVRPDVAVWWDYRPDGRFQPNHFADATHLNRLGGALFASLIRDDVCRLARTARVAGRR